MNPPFDTAEKHIVHAFEIAPPGCRIIALCNAATLESDYTGRRRQLRWLISQHGHSEDIGHCFQSAERSTKVEVSLVVLTKPGQATEDEFDGFLIEDEEEPQANGIITYDIIRDLVNRYIHACKIFDLQLQTSADMHNLVGTFYHGKIALHHSIDQIPTTRATFKKELQYAAWNHVFQIMNMERFITGSLRDNIKKFCEKQTEIPFTMRNVYRMIEIIIGTHQDRMKRSAEDVFNRLTTHYHENRYHVEGWKTNSHYMLNRRFILPYVIGKRYGGGIEIQYRGQQSVLNDLTKVLCHLTGTHFDAIGDLEKINHKKDRISFGEWFTWGFFRCKGYKKGTLHIEFLDPKTWEYFNRYIADILSFQLPNDVKMKA